MAPILATLADAPPADEQCVYEPKHDGFRALGSVKLRAARAAVRLWSRGGGLDDGVEFPLRVLRESPGADLEAALRATA